MTEVLNFLNNNTGALTVIFSGVVTLATAVYAVLTWRLVSETRLMRQVQTEPKIEITVKSLEIAMHIVRLHIRNIGLGPALNLKFSPRVVAGGESAERLITEFTAINFFNVGLAYVGPGEERLSHYTQMTEDHDGKMASVIAFDVEYGSFTGQRYKEMVTIDMSELKGSVQIGTPHLYAIAQSLEQLQKDIGQIASGFKGIRADVYTSEDRKAEAEATRRRIEQQRAKEGI